jgi:hypothetical protein
VSLSKGRARIEAALARFFAAQSALDNAPDAGALLDYTARLAELHSTVQTEVDLDMAAARERWPTPATRAEFLTLPTKADALRPIAYGTLPLHSFIARECAAIGVSANAFLAACRKELREVGASPSLLNTLHTVNVTWRAPKGCTCEALPCECIERDIDDVRRVLEASAP